MEVWFHLALAGLLDIGWSGCLSAPLISLVSRREWAEWGGRGARIFIFNDPDLFTQKDLVPQSNKQTAWHKADIEEGREDKWWVWTAALIMLAGSHAGDFVSFCRVCIFFSSCSSVLIRSLPSKHGQERTAGPSREKKECFPLYRCSQQGIMLLFCPGSKPFAAGWSSQDGSSLQGQGISPPPAHVHVCACSPHRSCLRTSSVLLLELIDYHEGGRLPSAPWQKLPQYGSIITFLSHLSPFIPCHFSFFSWRMPLPCLPFNSPLISDFWTWPYVDKKRN